MSRYSNQYYIVDEQHCDQYYEALKYERFRFWARLGCYALALLATALLFSSSVSKWCLTVSFGLFVLAIIIFAVVWLCDLLFRDAPAIKEFLQPDEDDYQSSSASVVLGKK